VSASHFADGRLAEWLAKPTKWLASRNAGRGRVMPPKSTPTPETSQLALAQATFASQKVNSPFQREHVTETVFVFNGDKARMWPMGSKLCFPCGIGLRDRSAADLLI
jgi:hypothetical protein